MSLVRSRPQERPSHMQLTQKIRRFYLRSAVASTGLNQISTQPQSEAGYSIQYKQSTNIVYTVQWSTVQVYSSKLELEIISYLFIYITVMKNQKTNSKYKYCHLYRKISKITGREDFQKIIKSRIRCRTGSSWMSGKHQTGGKVTTTVFPQTNP